MLASKSSSSAIYKLNCETVDATKKHALCYKPNRGFYTTPEGLAALRNTVAHIRNVAPDVPVIYDAKFGDIGNTNDGYVEETFDWLKADAVTIHCYMGMEAMRPFLDQADKGIFVLCKTSNKGSDEFQKPYIENGMQMYEYVAQNVATNWNKNSNCGLVVGATYPEQLSVVRGIVGDMPILLPDLGSQGGDVQKSIRAGINSNGSGLLPNSSSGIMFASDKKGAVQKLTDEINEALAKL